MRENWKSIDYGGAVHYDRRMFEDWENKNDSYGVKSNLLHELSNVVQRDDRFSGNYMLRNVRIYDNDDENEEILNTYFLDIHMQVFNLTEEQMNFLDDLEKNIPWKPEMFNFTELPIWHNIKPLLNGYARIIEFQAFDESDMDFMPYPLNKAKNMIISMKEGTF